MARRHRPSTLATSKGPLPEPPGRKGAGRGSWQAPGPAPAAAAPLARWEWLFLAALVVAVLLVYQPAWHGGFIWDDDAHVTKPELRSWQGLYRIWFELGATQQYYPLLHSVFWVEHRLWGDATLGYHLVNLLLHAAAAVMVALVLRRLAIPGAYLAAAIFALHPVQVESVAWITEQKNTLSAVFYLGAMLLYLRFDQTRKTPSYCWALGLFVLGLLSKTTAATLPAALLVIFWWQRGWLSWRRDIWPLLPFFVLGVAAGQLTAWVERMMIELGGAQVELTMVERCLIAGRAIWFYLGKLLWPAELIFIYPRWQVSSVVWWQYLFPATALLLLASAWGVRRRWRGPLAGLLFFVGTLFPALGFYNLFPFLFSFVADHFQYLASLGMITLASAGIVLLLDRWRLSSRPAGYLLCLMLLAALATLTWRQSQMYGDIETLYGKTIAENPDCWLAHNNLGNVLQSRGRIDEAIAHYEKALEIKPDYAKAHSNLGVALTAKHRFDEAMKHYQEALKISPDDADVHYNFAFVLARRGRLDEAIAHYRKGMETKPNDAEAHNNLGAALQLRGKIDEAVAQFQQALQIQPGNVNGHRNLGNVLVGRGRFEEALAQFQQALKLKPDDVESHRNLAWLRATCPQKSLRNAAEAVEHARRANQLGEGGRPDVLCTLAAAYAEAGQFPEALAAAHKALDLATQQNNRALADTLRGLIRLYEAGKPYRQTPSPSAPALSKP